MNDRVEGTLSDLALDSQIQIVVYIILLNDPVCTECLHRVCSLGANIKSYRMGPIKISHKV